MRFWAAAPEPGSLREIVGIIVEEYEERRQFEYVAALMMAASNAGNAKAQESMQKLLKSMNDRFFGAGKTQVEDTELKAFQKMVETHVVKVDVGKLVSQGAKPAERPLQELGKMVFNKDPKGILVD